MTPEIMLGTNFLSLKIRVLMKMKIRNVDATEAIIILCADKTLAYSARKLCYLQTDGRVI